MDIIRRFFDGSRDSRRRSTRLVPGDLCRFETKLLLSLAVAAAEIQGLAATQALAPTAQAQVGAENGSAPGPDGGPNLVLASTSADDMELLFQMMLAADQGGVPPVIGKVSW